MANQPLPTTEPITLDEIAARGIVVMGRTIGRMIYFDDFGNRHSLMVPKKAQTVEVAEEITTTKQRVLNFLGKSDRPVRRKMIFDALNAKPGGHLATVLGEMVKAGQVVRIDKRYADRVEKFSPAS